MLRASAIRDPAASEETCGVLRVVPRWGEPLLDA